MRMHHSHRSSIKNVTTYGACSNRSMSSKQIPESIRLLLAAAYVEESDVPYRFVASRTYLDAIKYEQIAALAACYSPVLALALRVPLDSSVRNGWEPENIIVSYL